MTRVYVMDTVTAYADAGRSEQPPSSSIIDYRQCPCVKCSYRATCEVECSLFKAYLRAPAPNAQRRLHPATCSECGAEYMASRVGTKWCSEACRARVRARRKAVSV